jgi:hypothetical protein
MCSSNLLCTADRDDRLPDGDRLVVSKAYAGIEMATFGLHTQPGMWWKGLCIVNRGDDASRWSNDTCISSENDQWSRPMHAHMPGDPAHGIVCKDVVLWKAKEAGIHRPIYLVTMSRVVDSDRSTVVVDWFKD